MTTTEKPLRVLELRVKNVMRLRTAAVRPPSHVVPVTGLNGSGKTTLLECIGMAVGGSKAVPDEPIREGAEKGEIVLDIGEYLVRRTFTREGTYLHLETADGAKVTRPQEVLDRLYTALTVDPLAFTRMSPKDQSAMLMRLAGLDFTKADELRKKAYDERTVVNRQRDAAVTKYSACGEMVPEGTPDEEQSAAQMIEQLTAMRNRQAGSSHAELSMKRMRDEIARLEEQLVKYREALEKLEAAERDTPVPSIAEIVEMQNRIQAVEQTNRAVRAKRMRAQLKAERDDLAAKSEKLTDRIEEIDRRKKEMLAESKLPVVGLEFDESGVRFNGQPLAQASQAEKIRVSVAIALANQPRLRVILVRDASLLDAESRAAMEAVAAEMDAQLWLEFVEADATDGVHVIDGVAENVKPTNAGDDPGAAMFDPAMQPRAARKPKAASK